MKLERYRSLFLSIYETHRGQLQHEDNLVNHRVSWLVASQSFLLGTYAFLVNSPAVHGIGIERKSGDPDLEPFLSALRLLRQCFSVGGMTASVAVGLSSWAALFALRDVVVHYHKSVANLQEQASGIDDQEREAVEALVPDIISRGNWRLLGSVACIVFPPLFASIWLAIFLRSIGQDVALGVGITVFAVAALLQVILFSSVRRDG